MVGGSLSITEGQVPNGMVVYGGTLDATSSSFPCGDPKQVPDVFPFANTCADLEEISQVRAMAVTPLLCLLSTLLLISPLALVLPFMWVEASLRKR